MGAAGGKPACTACAGSDEGNQPYEATSVELSPDGTDNDQALAANPDRGNHSSPLAPQIEKALQDKGLDDEM